MAESVLKAQDSFRCAFCLGLLEQPVTIPCGHSYCLDCINQYWDQDAQMGVYSCPQCRKTFIPRPVLNKNTMLAELAEGLRKTKLQAAPPDDTFAGPGDVECDVCTGRKHKAFKSCLVCLASYCETHIKAHYESPAFQKHNLAEASGNLNEKICPHHYKLLEIFCRSDQKFICCLCAIDDHSGHRTVSIVAERNEKQKQLMENQKEFHKRIEQREEKLQNLSRSMKSLRCSAQAAAEDSEKIFTELILSIERKCAEVKEQIRAQEQAELNLAEDLQRKLEQEIADLRRRDTKLGQLLHTEDHIHFLQGFQSHFHPPGPADVDFLGPAINTHISTDNLKKAVFKMKQEVEKLDRLQLVNLSGRSDSPEQQWDKFLVQGPISGDDTGYDIQREWDLLGFKTKFASPRYYTPDVSPITRRDFLRYSCQLTFDPNTAHSRLHLSERNRKVTLAYESQFHPVHPERFDTVHQVLCKESLSGRCYWEVECSVLKRSAFALLNRKWSIAVCYKNISRKGDGTKSKFGCNDQSWTLRCRGSNFSFRYNNEVTQLGVISSCSRIGVYVDHSAGILSFYSVSTTMTLLRTVHTTFTNPLCAGAGIYGNDNYVKICDLN